jgi:hypothetical protein
LIVRKAADRPPQLDLNLFDMTPLLQGNDIRRL